MELVVAGVRQVNSKPGPHAVENLYSGVCPDPGDQQLLPVHGEVEGDAVHRALQHEAPHQQDGQHHVGHGGGDPDNLPGGLDSLEERDVEETVDHTNTDDQRPLGAPEIVDTIAILNPQNLQAATERCERLNVEIFLFT